MIPINIFILIFLSVQKKLHFLVLVTLFFSIFRETLTQNFTRIKNIDEIFYKD